MNETFLKVKYRGILLTVCAMGMDEQVFPLVFAVVDYENNSSWKWFLTMVKHVIGNREEMVVITDKYKDILQEVKEVYPKAKHVYCMRHFLNNIKKYFHDLIVDVN